jgi:hypothetical protein
MWPIGDPDKPGFKYCDSDACADTRAPYCQPHLDLAYVKGSSLDAKKKPVDERPEQGIGLQRVAGWVNEMAF